jgi:hypothetical protein
MTEIAQSGDSEIDWLMASATLSIIVFVAAFSAVILYIAKRKPCMLKSQSATVNILENGTTYNWPLIFGIVENCIKFSGGVFIVTNVIVFLVFGQWYIDPRTVGVLATAFAFLLFQSFDKFVTKLVK